MTRSSRTAKSRHWHAAAAVALTIAGACAHADTVGLRLGAYRWQPDFDGDVRADGETVDINRDLGLDDDDSNVFFVAIEHPVPLLPNVML